MGLKVNKISDEVIRLLKKKSVLTVGKNPSEKGLTSQQIIEALTNPTFNTIDEINRIVDEINNFVAKDEITEEEIFEKIADLFSKTNATQIQLDKIQEKVDSFSGTEEIHIGDDEPVGDNFKIWIPSSDEPIIEKSELVSSYATFSLRRSAIADVQDDFAVESASTYVIEEEEEVYDYVNSDSENSVTRTYVIEEEEEEEVYEYVTTDPDNNVVNTYEITSNSRTYPYYSKETGLVYNK